VDRSKFQPKPLIAPHEKQTIRRFTSDRSTPADCPRLACGLSGKPLATRTQDPSRSNHELGKTSDELDELGTSRTVRGDLADGPPGANQHRKQPRGKKEKIKNSIKRPPKITKFESRLHNNTKNLFPIDLPKKIKPSPPEK
jgi:hypothetical protein